MASSGDAASLGGSSPTRLQAACPASELHVLARRGDVGLTADEDHATAEPLVALQVESLQLVLGETCGEFIGLLGGCALPEAADGDDIPVATVHHLIGVEARQRFKLPGQ